MLWNHLTPKSWAPAWLCFSCLNSTPFFISTLLGKSILSAIYCSTAFSNITLFPLSKDSCNTLSCFLVLGLSHPTSLHPTFPFFPSNFSLKFFLLVFGQLWHCVSSQTSLHHTLQLIDYIHSNNIFTVNNSDNTKCSSIHFIFALKTEKACSLWRNQSRFLVFLYGCLSFPLCPSVISFFFLAVFLSLFFSYLFFLSGCLSFSLCPSVIFSFFLALFLFLSLSFSNFFFLFGCLSFSLCPSIISSFFLAVFLFLFVLQ